MCIEEDPTIDVWMADVSHYVFKISNELVLKVKGYKNLLFWKVDEQCKFKSVKSSRQSSWVVLIFTVYLLLNFD